MTKIVHFEDGTIDLKTTFATKKKQHRCLKCHSHQMLKKSSKPKLKPKKNK